MSDDSDLLRKLAALTAERKFDGGAMDLGPSGGDTALAEVLQVIDNTMLPRHLVFSVGPTSVTLSVSGRRLRALIAVQGDVSAQPDLHSKLLTVAEPASLMAVGDVLRELTAKHGTLYVTRLAAQSVDGASDTGVSVSQLVGAWDVDLTSKPPTHIEQFCLALGADLLAMAVIKDGNVNAGLGNEVLLAQVKQVWSDHAADFCPGSAMVGAELPNNLIILRQGLITGDADLLFVKLQDISVLSAVSSGKIASVTAAWTQALS